MIPDIWGEPFLAFLNFTWVLVVITTQLHSTNPELRFCAGLNPACGVSEIRDGEDVWQWSRLQIKQNAFRRSTISQKQFIIIITNPGSLFVKLSIGCKVTFVRGRHNGNSYRFILPCFATFLLFSKFSLFLIAFSGNLFLLMVHLIISSTWNFSFLFRGFALWPILYDSYELLS